MNKIPSVSSKQTWRIGGKFVTNVCRTRDPNPLVFQGNRICLNLTNKTISDWPCNYTSAIFSLGLKINKSYAE